MHQRCKITLRYQRYYWYAYMAYGPRCLEAKKRNKQQDKVDWVQWALHRWIRLTYNIGTISLFVDTVHQIGVCPRESVNPNSMGHAVFYHSQFFFATLGILCSHFAYAISMANASTWSTANVKTGVQVAQGPCARNTNTNPNVDTNSFLLSFLYANSQSLPSLHTKIAQNPPFYLYFYFQGLYAYLNINKHYFSTPCSKTKHSLHSSLHHKLFTIKLRCYFRRHRRIRAK